MNILAATENQLIQFYLTERNKTEKLCSPLETEDYIIQTMDDVSPPKWHLAHTTWFFEAFILIPYLKNYHSYNHHFQYLFNSYYHQIGRFYPRTKRGCLSRPTVKTIYEYRRYVDSAIADLLTIISDEQFEKIRSLIILGINHEQQHQELLLMDIKNIFFMNLDYPVYQFEKNLLAETNVIPPTWFIMPGGLIEIGYAGNQFCFDNELPRHEAILKPYSISSKLVTNGEFLEFINTDGYKNPNYWLSDGWDWIQKNNIFAPLYWQRIENDWYVFTLHGLKKINLHEPVSHISFYEADAFARSRGCRLPTEAEWENFVAAQKLLPEAGNFLESNNFHPKPCVYEEMPSQFFGDVWEWTSSAYSPYPGYKTLTGALGEYNGKFMSNQMVLRGGSCVTPITHIRHSYRNFFQPDKRWEFSGIRLAKDTE